MRHPKRMIAAIERAIPGTTAREWGAIAIEAARRAGLEEPDIRSLRTDLEHQWAISDSEAREHGNGHHDRCARR